LKSDKCDNSTILLGHTQRDLIMAEPTISSVTVGGSVGIMALLIGSVGPVAADVMMVVISAIAGCYIALSSMQAQTLLRSLGFVLTGVAASLVFAWALAGFLTGMFPSLGGPYLPSIIAMFTGFLTNRLPEIFNTVFDKLLTTVGLKPKNQRT
jgi:hypothetical protein